jgi:hypothetical protein
MMAPFLGYYSKSWKGKKDLLGDLASKGSVTWSKCN